MLLFTNLSKTVLPDVPVTLSHASLFIREINEAVSHIIKLTRIKFSFNLNIGAVQIMNYRKTTEKKNTGEK